MKHKRPDHCKECTGFHNAGRSNPTKTLEKYNAWCCIKGAPAVDSTGWCKTHNAKRPRTLYLGDV